MGWFDLFPETRDEENRIHLENETLRESLERQLKAMEEQGQHVARLRANEKRLREELADLRQSKKDLAKLNKSLREEKKKVTDEAASRRHEAAGLRSEVKGLDGLLKDARSDARELERERDALVDALKEEQRADREHRQELFEITDRHMAELAATKAHLVEKEHDIERLKASLVEVTAQKDNILSSYDGAVKDFMDCRDELGRVRSELGKMTSDRNGTKEALRQTARRVKELEGEASQGLGLVFEAGTTVTFATEETQRLRWDNERLYHIVQSIRAFDRDVLQAPDSRRVIKALYDLASPEVRSHLDRLQEIEDKARRFTKEARERDDARHKAILDGSWKDSYGYPDLINRDDREDE